MEGVDGYLYGLFSSSSLCLHLPNTTGYGYLAYTTSALENSYQFPKNGISVQMLFLTQANQKIVIYEFIHNSTLLGWLYLLL